VKPFLLSVLGATSNQTPLKYKCSIRISNHFMHIYLYSSVFQENMVLIVLEKKKIIHDNGAFGCMTWLLLDGEPCIAVESNSQSSYLFFPLLINSSVWPHIVWQGGKIFLVFNTPSVSKEKLRYTKSVGLRSFFAFSARNCVRCIALTKHFPVR
jgi:hypothetical protein